ncbi:MAG: hypothetical protein HQ492_01005 [Woeseiaceae bacterium]|nr:hypothetical protein [Woeseiaceae bacterium]
MLEAAMVRCSANRDATRYDAECVNARQASQLIESKNAAVRRTEQEARSERKRQAFRATQEAAAQARRRVADAERRRIEAEYLAQFGVLPPSVDQSSVEKERSGNLPQVVIPETSEQSVSSSGSVDTVRATDGGNAPGSAVAPTVEEPTSDLESIRNELQRRKEEGGN